MTVGNCEPLALSVERFLNPILSLGILCGREVDQLRLELPVHLLHRLDLHRALDRPVDHRIQPLDAGQIIVKRI